MITRRPIFSTGEADKQRRSGFFGLRLYGLGDFGPGERGAEEV